MRFDAHQHFWHFDEREYGWMKSDWPIRRDFLPEHLAPHLSRHGIRGSVAVQARQTLEESDWLLSLAEAHSSVAAVVGWVDLRAPQVDDDLERLSEHPRFKGVRHIVQDEPDDEFIARPEFIAGVSKLKKYDLVYDILVFPRQLDAARRMVEELPDQVFVLDHMAKPEIAAQPEIAHDAFSQWRRGLEGLAQHESVFCKVSGLVTQTNWHSFEDDDFRPYLDVALEAFGPSRLMYGSDWPVCLLAAEYDRVFSIAERFAEHLSASEQELFFGGTAARCYGLPALG